MGTRHFVGVIADGKYKIAQYGQFDGYIEGQGATVLEFLSNMMKSEKNIEIFKNNTVFLYQTFKRCKNIPAL